VTDIVLKIETIQVQSITVNFDFRFQRRVYVRISVGL